MDDCRNPTGVFFPEALRAALPLAAVVIALLVVAGLARKRDLFLGPEFDLPLVALLVMLVVSLAVSLAVSVDRHASLVQVTTTLAGMLVFWLGARRWRQAPGMLVACVWLLLIGCVVAAAGLVGAEWQPVKLFTLWPVYDHLPRLILSTPHALIGDLHANQLGGALAVCLPSTLGLALYLGAQKQPGWDGRRPWLVWLIGLLLAMMTAVLILTQSRTSYIGAAAGLAAMLVLLQWQRLVRFLPALLVCALAATGVWAIASARIDSRSTVTNGLSGLASIGVVDGASADDGAARSEIWTNAVRMLRDYPFTGAGLYTFPVVSRANYAYNVVLPDYPLGHSHNIFLQTGVDFGVVGLAALFVLLLVLARCGLDLAVLLSKQTAALLAAGVSGSLVVCVVAGLGDISTLPFGIHGGFLFWIASGALAGAWRSERANHADQRPNLSPTHSRRVPWPGVIVVIAAIMLLGGPTALTWLQVNRASVALDHLLLRPASSSAARADGIRTLLPLLRSTAHAVGSWQSVRLGRAYLELGDTPAALAAWQQALAQAVTYLVSQGDAYWWRSNRAPAERYYRLALQVAASPQSQYRLARALESVRDDEALTLYGQVLAESVATFDTASRSDARLRMGRLLARSGDWPAALEQYDLGLAAAPAAGDLLVAKAEAIGRLKGSNRPDEAFLLQASAARPGSVPVYKALVALYLQNGQADNARMWAERSLRTMPGSVWPQMMMGQALLSQDEAPAAITYFRRADLMRRNLADPHLGLADAYRRMGDIDKAVTETQTAAETEPYKPEVQAAVGDMLRELGKGERAHKAYERTLALDAQNEQARQGLLALERGAATVP